MTTRKALLKAHAVRWNAVRKELQKNCRLAALPVEFAQASSNLPVQRQSRSFHRTTTETRAEPKSKLKTLYVGSVPVLVLKSLGAKMDWGRSARNAAQEGARRTERRQRDAAQKRSPSRCCVFQGHVQYCTVGRADRNACFWREVAGEAKSGQGCSGFCV